MIHQYKLNGYNIVLDVYSGSIHIPDDAAYDAIRMRTSRISSPTSMSSKGRAGCSRRMCTGIGIMI